jgi:type VI secretion system lysozyme-like protein
MQPKKHNQQAPLMKRLLQGSNKRISHSDWTHYVAESLGLLLNTRQGSAAASSQYGLPDFNELTHTPAQLIKHLECSMVKAIATYEPRLKQVKVLGEVDEEIPDRLRFNIHGVLELGIEKYPVNYQSVLTPGGRARDCKKLRLSYEPDAQIL